MQSCWASWRTRKFDLTSPDLRDNILHFYSDLSLPLKPRRTLLAGKVYWRPSTS